MELVVLDINGKETGRKVSLDETIFGIEPNGHVIYLEIKQYLAAQRQGTHKAKERSEVAGSTRKIKKQKGTGGARAGNIKSPTIRGGGTVFGPRPRDYSFKINKVEKRLAKRSLLSQKISNNQFMIVEDFNFDTPKSKDFSKIIDSLGLNNKKSLFVLGDSNKNVYLSSRNLQGTKVVNHTELNSYDILNASGVVFLEGAVEKVQEILRK